MSSPKKTCSLSIELLPEFGWSIRNQPVYGPGSVFQGFVNLNIDTPMSIERVRLVFYAIETIPSFEVSPGVIRSAKNMIFSTQTVLWHSNQTLQQLSQKRKHIFPFTIQMPMIQFPPSVDHTSYKCNFLLVALLDTPTLDIPVIKKEVPVLCMPFVTTSFLKIPTVLTKEKKSLSAKVQMTAQEYVLGDNISLNLHVERKNNWKKESKNSLQFVTAHLKLIQTLSIRHSDDIPDQIKCVASVSSNLLLIKSLDGSGMYCDGDLTLKIPNDISPSYDYGKLANIFYRLQITVEQKSSLGNIWKQCVSLDSVHITIGTLGYGIRSSNEIKLYSDLDTPISPLFMKAVEYEDALPLYDSSKLPSYENIPSF
ncbi:hypothetical protein BD770DRAFT_390230 [Pilaira anomala]|nr:hypothetical protein BD770DRAFT_390230 [Pilaira anomala]